MKEVKTLPGIKNISYINTSQLLQAMEYKDAAGLPNAIYGDLTIVPFTGTASCQSVRETQNNGYIETTTLKFSSACILPEFESLAFVVTDANGQSYCIGAHEAPKVIIKRTRESNPPSSDPSTISYEVKRTSIRTLLPIIS